MDKASISVSPEIAVKYNKITPQDQLKIQTLLSLMLDKLSGNDATSSLPEEIKAWILMYFWMEEMDSGQEGNLKDIMDTIGERAAERGLTPEILDELLADES